MRPRVLAVAQDANPSRGFEALASVSGETMRLMVGNGKSFPHNEKTVSEMVVQSDVVLIGMSSSEVLAFPELVAAKAAIALRKPLACYGDIAGCFNRKWFADIAPHVAVYFGSSLNDATAAQSVFQNAVCYGFGNPLDDAMTFSRFTREEVRRRLLVGKDEVMVLAPGTKSITENCTIWGLLIDSLQQLSLKGKTIKLFLAAHPGDRSTTAVDVKGNALSLYEEFVTRSPFSVSLLDKEIFSSSDALAGVDLVVAFGGSIGREAGFKRIPVMSIGTEVAYQRMFQETDDRIPEAVKLGLAKLVSSESSLIAEVVDRLLNQSSVERKLMLQQQLVHCVPPPHHGYAAEQMWRTLSALL
jgi:hypothetical protein